MSVVLSLTMRHLVFLTLTAVCALAQVKTGFTTGQGARLVIGQRTFTAQESGAGQEVLGAVSGLAYANETLIVVDSNRVGAEPQNHRVLLFNNLSSKLPAPTAEIPHLSRCPVCTGSADVVLGQPDFTKKDLRAAANNTVRSPIGAATDGVSLAIADTDNNRVLIWNTIPQANNSPANVVVGQPDFARVLPNDGQGSTPTNRSFRGPQGVWIQSGRLFVADSANNRILIWNSLPRSNHQPADLVLGQPDFTTFVQQDLTKTTLEAKRDNLLTPVSVTSDGTRLYVTDLGHNRVLIWNTIPTRNNQPPDVVLGQPDFESAVLNNGAKLCEATEKDADGKDIPPTRCEATLEYPRFALSDGKYLFIADGGNDRVLVYDQIPTQNGAKADSVLGQIAPRFNLISDSADPRGIASAGAVRTPHSLAWDGTNLYVSDPFNRRVMVFTIAERKIPHTGVRNAASREVFALGAVTFSGEVKENQEISIKIRDREYKYKVKKDERFDQVVNGLVGVINAGAGDPEVFATPNLPRAAIILTARAGGAPGNEVEISTSVAGDASLVATASGATLSGGQDAALIAPGTIVSVLGDNLAETTASAPADASPLPLELAGVQVYFDGIRAHLFSVSPTEVRAQVPWEVLDTQSINVFVRTRKNNGDVSVSSALAVPIIPQNPGIFAVEGVVDPRPAVAMHGSAFATGTVSVDGSIRAGDLARVFIEDREYVYTVKEGDTLASVRDALIELINQDPKVEALAAAAFTRIRLRARQEGPEGNELEYSANSREGDQVILTATTPKLCCANRGLITEQNPAQPGETIIVMATGLGIVKPDEARMRQHTGFAYDGPVLNDPLEFVSSLAGGKTANVLAAALKPGTIGIFEVILELNSDIPTDPKTQITIAQDIFVSNIVTIPVFNPEADTTP